MYQTLITPEQLHNIHEDCVIFDVSYDLTTPNLGRSQYATEHIAGAQYLDLRADLSATTPLQHAYQGGRHPLPLPQDWIALLQSYGVDNDTQLVVYDRQNTMYAPRLWWMCRWVGHANIAVLDGGLPAWKTLYQTTAAGSQLRSLGTIALRATTHAVLDRAQVHARQPTDVLIDARSAHRYRGAEETIDARAGHIPGALNQPFTTLWEDGKLRGCDAVHRAFDRYMGATSVIHYCGSGVTAAVNILAMQHCMPDVATALYAGSWSDWSATMPKEALIKSMTGETEKKR